MVCGLFGLVGRTPLGNREYLDVGFEATGAAKAAEATGIRGDGGRLPASGVPERNLTLGRIALVGVE